MNRAIISLSACFFIILFSCADKSITTANTDGEDSLNYLSSDIVIKYSNAGGMSPFSENIFISNDSASWKYGRYREQIILAWVPQPNDIESIIQVLNDNKYSKIQSDRKEEVYDRGGMHIKISYQNQMIDLNNSGLNFIKQEWQENFRAIQQYINDYVQGEVEKQMLTLEFVQAPSAQNSAEPVKVWLNNQLFYDSKEQQNQAPQSINIYPGVNKYEWTLYYADSVGFNNRPVRKNGGESKFDAAQSSKSITLEIVESEIIMKVD